MPETTLEDKDLSISSEIETATLATLISILPFEMRENKPGIYPGAFNIPAAKDNDFELLIIGSSKYHVYIPIAERTITIDEAPHKVAQSVVRDYCNSCIAIKPGAAPGIMWVAGGHTKEDIRVNYKIELEALKDRQVAWFQSLVRMADDDWAKHHQHKFISDLQRYAAMYLKLDKDWLTAIETPDVMACPVCKSQISPDAIKCAVCQSVVNKEAWAEYQKGLVLGD